MFNADWKPFSPYGVISQVLSNHRGHQRTNTAPNARNPDSAAVLNTGRESSSNGASFANNPAETLRSGRPWWPNGDGQTLGNLRGSHAVASRFGLFAGRGTPFSAQKNTGVPTGFSQVRLTGRDSTVGQGQPESAPVPPPISPSLSTSFFRATRHPVDGTTMKGMSTSQRMAIDGGHKTRTPFQPAARDESNSGRVNFYSTAPSVPTLPRLGSHASVQSARVPKPFASTKRNPDLRWAGEQAEAVIAHTRVITSATEAKETALLNGKMARSAAVISAMKTQDLPADSEIVRRPAPTATKRLPIIPE